MAFEPKNITRDHVLKAIEKIETEGIGLIDSTRWLVEINDKQYPLKEVMRYAHEQMNGEKIWERSGGDPTNNYFENLGFNVIDKTNDPVKSIIKLYKQHIRQNGLTDEVYKWQLIQKFKGRPDTTAIDFAQEIKAINFSNLVFYNARTVANFVVEKEPEQYRECFKQLFDESVLLDTRIIDFETEFNNIYRLIGGTLQNHHDERTMATILTFHNPKKYTFYKNSFYKEFCNLLGIKSKAIGHKYAHYLELIDSFISDYLLNDQELLDLVDGELSKYPDCYEDQNRNILAQDIIYQMYDKLGNKDKVIGLMASDNTGWQDYTISDFQQGAFDTLIVWNSKRPTGTNKTTKFLKEIIERGDSFNLYYSSRGFVNYKVTIIDFAENQTELDNKNWLENYKIMGFDEDFENYEDENKKARIIFLANNFEKISPIPISDFEFYNGASSPVQDNLSPIKKEPELEYIETEQKSVQIMKSSKQHLNQILYGPPGTGKTYNTINKAIEIINPEFYKKNKNDYDVIHKEFNRLLIKDFEKTEGQIAFCTFHQSFTYEDFVEGIKPLKPKDGEQLKYDVQTGILKKICDLASKEKQLISLENAYENFKNEVVDNNFIVLKTPIHEKTFRVVINSNGNCIATPQTDIQTDMVISKAMIFDYLLNENIRDWKPYLVPICNYIKAKFNFSLELSGNSKKPYVLIIDEINRGNVSSVFGELITLIECNKRNGEKETLEVILPYSKEPFSVPANLYIIGTMNTADRSVEALDSALRRRFSFEEMPSKPELVAPNRCFWELLWKYKSIDWDNEEYIFREKELLDLLGASSKVWDERKAIWKQFKTEGKNESQIEQFSNSGFNGINFESILRKINKRIEILLDKDHEIGHSYFMGVTNLQDLKYVFHNKIIPLLKEYFFGDYGKIGLVLGSGFVSIEKYTDSKKLFASFDNSYDAADLAERVIYKIANVADPSFDIKAAIESLLNN